MAKAKALLQHELIIKRRPATGSRRVSRLRREGLVPGVVYGKELEPLAVAVPSRELVKLLHSKAGEHALVTLRLEDGKTWEKPALVKSVQHDPVDGRVIHVDFHAIVLTERIKVKVPVVLKGEPVGVKQEGGILEHFLREIEVECLPTEIPASVEFEVGALKIGDTVHVSDLVAPRNGKITSDPAGVIASVQEPKAEKPEEAGAAAVTEPEIIREKKEEGEAPAAEEEAKETKGEPPAAKKEAKS
jgi:large subunit ribosomal protein L25